MKRLLLLLLLALPAASAHSAVVGVSPAENSLVAAPTSVEITFNEPVNLRFSTFKVYPLKLSGSATPLQLSRAAAQLVKRTLPLKSDTSERADEFRAAPGNVTRVILPLRPQLASGPYVVMWRVLSADGHPVTGHYLFRVK